MEETLFDHPWQAVPISLFKLSPGEDPYTHNSFDQWSSAQTSLLERILDDYDAFRVVPKQDSRVGVGEDVNNYYEYTRAELYGLGGEDGEGVGSRGESVAHRFALELAGNPL